MTMMFKTTASALALALGAAYAAPAALAQQAPPPPQQGMPAQQQPQIEPVTDEGRGNLELRTRRGPGQRDR